MTLRLGAAARPEVIAGVGVIRVARVGLTGGLVTVTSIAASSSSSLASSGSGIEVAFVDFVAARPVLLLVVGISAGFFVTLDFDSIARALVVVGTGSAFDSARRDDVAIAVVSSTPPGRARVVRRGFTGEAGGRGAMLTTSGRVMCGYR